MQKLWVTGTLLVAQGALADEPAVRVPPSARVVWTVVATSPDLKQQRYNPSRKSSVQLAAPSPWTCEVSRIQVSPGQDTSSEAVFVECSAGQAAVSNSVLCLHSKKPLRPAASGTAERQWKPTASGGFMLAQKGQRDGWHILLSCSVDIRYAFD
jgi:hypothetical protein